MDTCIVIGADRCFECVFGTMLLNQTELLHGDETIHCSWDGPGHYVEAEPPSQMSRFSL